MTARIITGTMAQVLAELYQATRGITVDAWVRGESICAECYHHVKYCECTRTGTPSRASGRKEG